LGPLHARFVANADSGEGAEGKNDNGSDSTLHDHFSGLSPGLPGNTPLQSGRSSLD